LVEKIKEEFCTGIIPLHRVNTTWEVLIVKHKKGDYWGFPKGHCSKGEDPIKAAKRELVEETKLQVIKIFDQSPLKEDYIFYRGSEKIHKTVHYYIAEVTKDVQLQDSEIADARFVKPQDLLPFFTFPEGQRIVKELKEILLLQSYN